MDSVTGVPARPVSWLSAKRHPAAWSRVVDPLAMAMSPENRTATLAEPDTLRTSRPRVACDSVAWMPVADPTVRVRSVAVIARSPPARLIDRSPLALP